MCKILSLSCNPTEITRDHTDKFNNFSKALNLPIYDKMYPCYLRFLFILPGQRIAEGLQLVENRVNKETPQTQYHQINNSEMPSKMS